MYYNNDCKVSNFFYLSIIYSQFFLFDINNYLKV